MIVSIDIGNGYIKAINSNGSKLHFPSIVQECDIDFDLDSNSEEYLLELNNNKYFIGELAILEQGTRIWSSTKMNEFTDIFIATCLNLLSENENEVDLCLGLPYSYYVEQEKGIHLINQYTNKEFKSIVNNNRKKTKIKSVRVFAQGSGAFFSNMVDIDGYLKNDIINNFSAYFIDIGYRTVDCVQYVFKNNLRLVASSSFSLEDLGIYRVYNFVVQALNMQVGTFWSNLDIEEAVLHNNYILRHGLVGEYNIQKLTQKYQKNLAQLIFSQINSRVPNLQKIENIYLSGGGAPDLFEYFKSEFPNIKLQKNNIFANAEGYLALANM